MPGRSLMVKVIPPALPTERTIWLWACKVWVSPWVRVRDRAVVPSSWTSTQQSCRAFNERTSAPVIGAPGAAAAVLGGGGG